VKVAFGLSKKQKKYLEWWSRRGTYGRGVIQKLSPRVFELPPNALSLYLLARLRENVGEAFLHVYPVGFSSDVPSAPKPVIELFGKQKLRSEELLRLRDLSLREY